MKKRKKLEYDIKEHEDKNNENQKGEKNKKQRVIF